MNRSLKKILKSPFALFTVTACIVFWPITLQLFTFKNDALTYYYPVRTLISDALHTGQLPLWTPYLNMGYPLHADMQSGAWNPVIWLIAGITDYRLAGFHLEFLLYIVFAGTGMYYLCRNYGFGFYAALAAGMAYQCSGFITDSTQFFACIASACYLPWIFFFFRKLLQTCQYKWALLLALMFYLMLTGGYPGLLVVTVYLLLFYFLFVFLNQQEKTVFIRNVFLPLSVSAILCCLLSLPALISFWQHLPHISRGSKQTIEFVQQNSLPPAAMLSFISPFSTTAFSPLLDTDPLMRNSYAGIVSLLFFSGGCIAVVKNRYKEGYFLIAATALSFLLAFGHFFIAHRLAYHFLPAFDMFRHPAIIRLAGIFCLLPVSAYGMEQWHQGLLSNKTMKRITIITGALCIVVVVTLAATTVDWGGIPYLLKRKSWFSLMRLSFGGRFLVEAPLTLGIVVSTYLLALRKMNMRILMLVALMDLFLAVQLIMPVTIIGRNSFATVEKTLNRNPERFPAPELQSITTNAAGSYNTSHPAVSSLLYSKKLGRNEYYITPGNLKLQDSFYESSIRNQVFKNAVVYFADTLINRYDPAQLHTPAFALTGSFNNKASSTKGDIRIIGFGANEMKLQTSCEDAAQLVFLQNYYPGWKAFIDNRAVKIERANISFMMIAVPAGEHSILFHYRPAGIILAWYAALATLAFTSLLLFFLQYKQQRNTKGEA